MCAQFSNGHGFKWGFEIWTKMLVFMAKMSGFRIVRIVGCHLQSEIQTFNVCSDESGIMVSGIQMVTLH